jgi:YopT peptidase
MSKSKITQLCIANNGVPTWGFSQSDVTVVTKIFGNPVTRWGICAGLSAKWIKQHADGGSMANDLGGGGLKISKNPNNPNNNNNVVEEVDIPLNIKQLQVVANLHASNSGPGNDQKTGIGNWLESGDVKPMSNSRIYKGENHKGKYWQGRATPREEMGNGIHIANIANEIVNALMKLHSCYVRINFGGKIFGLKESAHCVAAWIGQPSYSSSGDILFFDPNYGEFWFEHRSDFFKFFPLYYQEAYLSKTIRFDSSWEVLPSAPTV